MDKVKLQNFAVVAAALSATLAALYANTNWLSSKPMQTSEQERCYGLVRAGKNDCANAKHSCAGQAATNGDPNEFIMLPKGLCDKIVGGKSA